MLTPKTYLNTDIFSPGDVSHCHPADGSLVRVEKWGFEGGAPKTRVSLLKDGHVLCMNYHLKSDMDLKKEQKEREEKERELEKERAAVRHRSEIFATFFCFSISPFRYNSQC